MTRVTDEMVEAAAKAICREEHLLLHGTPVWSREELDTKVASYWPNHVIAARTALEAALAVAPKDEASERKSAFEAAEASAWPELEWPGEKKP